MRFGGTMPCIIANLIKAHLWQCSQEWWDVGSSRVSWIIRDHFVYAPSQWKTTLHCNVVFYWLGAYTKRSLNCIHSTWKLIPANMPKWTGIGPMLTETGPFRPNGDPSSHICRGWETVMQGLWNSHMAPIARREKLLQDRRHANQQWMCYTADK